jgi:hypothetical protein
MNNNNLPVKLNIILTYQSYIKNDESNLPDLKLAFKLVKKSYINEIYPYKLKSFKNNFKKFITTTNNDIIKNLIICEHKDFLGIRNTLDNDLKFFSIISYNYNGIIDLKFMLYILLKGIKNKFKRKYYNLIFKPNKPVIRFLMPEISETNTSNNQNININLRNFINKYKQNDKKSDFKILTEHYGQHAGGKLFKRRRQKIETHETFPFGILIYQNRKNIPERLLDINKNMLIISYEDISSLKLILQILFDNKFNKTHKLHKKKTKKFMQGKKNSSKKVKHNDNKVNNDIVNFFIDNEPYEKNYHLGQKRQHKTRKV